MGAYLNKPQTEKIPEDDVSDTLEYGASSMQGWRISQEDEHNCCLKFDTNTSLFAVYDGHGGAEVAQYTAQHFPDFLRNSTLYKDGQISEALEQTYLDFDAKLTDEKVQETLKQLAGLDSDEEDEDEKEHEAAKLFEEAHMPLDQLMLRYKSRTGGTAPPGRRFKKDKMQSPMNPMICTKAEFDRSDPESGVIELRDQLVNGHSSQGEKSDSIPDSSSGAVKSGSQQNGSDAAPSSSCVSSSRENTATCTDNTAEAKQLTASFDSEVAQSQETLEADCSSSVTGITSSATASNSSQAQDDTVGSSGVSASSSSPSKPGAGGSSSVQDGEPSSSSSRSGRKAARLSAEGDSESSLDEDEETSEDDASDDDEDIDQNRWKVGKGPCDDDDDTDDDDSEEEEGPFGDEDEADDEDQEIITGGEEPGYDSGCTAVVALLRGRELHVANSGDSRCVLSRAGKAVDMSEDHKPEDPVERARIIKAGGRITADGRVNGGLNMSRAIGDHRYKMNEEVARRDQMITALPDVRTVTLQDDDEFLVVACDGIWNTMSSQDVVTFVRDRIQADVRPLSAIIGEMFDLCLATNTAGDGTGCDNMTGIIVNLKPKSAESSEADHKEIAEAQMSTEQSSVSDSDVTASDDTASVKRKAEMDDGDASSSNKKSKMDCSTDSSC